MYFDNSIAILVYSHAHVKGKYKSNIYYSIGGTSEENKVDPGTGKYRPSGFDCIPEPECVPYSSEACKAAGKRLKLTPFSESKRYVTKGCYAYKTGKYAGKIYYGTGGATETEQANLTLPKYRPEGFDCKIKPPKCVPYSLKACKAVGKELNLKPISIGRYRTKGCFAYLEGSYAGRIYYGKWGLKSPYWDEEEEAQGELTLPKYRPSGFDCQPKCVPYSLEACQAAADQLGMHVESSSKYHTKGCYSYASGEYSYRIYYGTGGSTEQVRANLTLPKYRPPGFDCKYCVPYSLEACKDAGKTWDLIGPTTSSTYVTKGCYAYKSGSYAGKLYYGTGGSPDEIQTDLTLPKYRPSGFDCYPICIPFSLEACIVAGKNRGLIGPTISDKYTTKGCYAYESGPHAWEFYYGTGGSTEEVKADVSLPMFRPMGYDCDCDDYYDECD